MSPPSLEDLLREHYGLEVSLLGGAPVERVLQKQAQEAGLSVADRLTELAASPEALRRFVEAVTVHETWFARDGKPFELLAAEAVRWRRERWGEPPRIRVMSLACSTGEEAWSLAMALSEAGLRPEEFLIEAFDLSAAALDRARNGIYPARAFRSPLAQYWRDRWCEPDSAGFRVRPELRQSVRFAAANLLDVGAARGFARAHLIFCRNVMIYFSGEARQRLLHRLAGLLLPQGLLFTGHAEAALPPAEFEVFGPAGAFAFELRKAVEPQAARHRDAPPPRPPAPAPARVAARSAPLSSSGDPLAVASHLADAGRYREALEKLAEVLARELTNPRAWLLKGLAEAALGETMKAGNSLSKALYLEPDNGVALVAKARLESLAGRHDQAGRLRARAARLSPDSPP